MIVFPETVSNVIGIIGRVVANSDCTTNDEGGVVELRVVICSGHRIPRRHKLNGLRIQMTLLLKFKPQMVAAI